MEIKRKNGEVLIEVQGETLCGADLREADLREADLYGASLRGAKGVISFGPIGSERRIALRTSTAAYKPALGVLAATTTLQLPRFKRNTARIQPTKLCCAPQCGHWPKQTKRKGTHHENRRADHGYTFTEYGKRFG